MLNQLALVGIVKNDLELKHDDNNKPYTVVSIITKVTALEDTQFATMDYTIKGSNAVNIVRQNKACGGTLAYLRGSVVPKENGLELIACELAFLGSMLSN